MDNNGIIPQNDPKRGAIPKQQKSGNMEARKAPEDTRPKETLTILRNSTKHDFLYFMEGATHHLEKLYEELAQNGYSENSMKRELHKASAPKESTSNGGKILRSLQTGAIPQSEIVSDDKPSDAPLTEGDCQSGCIEKILKPKEGFNSTISEISAKEQIFKAQEISPSETVKHSEAYPVQIPSIKTEVSEAELHENEVKAVSESFDVENRDFSQNYETTKVELFSNSGYEKCTEQWNPTEYELLLKKLQFWQNMEAKSLRDQIAQEKVLEALKELPHTKSKEANRNYETPTIERFNHSCNKKSSQIQLDLDESEPENWNEVINEQTARGCKFRGLKKMSTSNEKDKISHDSDRKPSEPPFNLSDPSLELMRQKVFKSSEVKKFQEHVDVLKSFGKFLETPQEELTYQDVLLYNLEKIFSKMPDKILGESPIELMKQEFLEKIRVIKLSDLKSKRENAVKVLEGLSDDINKFSESYHKGDIFQNELLVNSDEKSLELPLHLVKALLFEDYGQFFENYFLIGMEDKHLNNAKIASENVFKAIEEKPNGIQKMPKVDQNDSLSHDAQLDFSPVKSSAMLPQSSHRDIQLIKADIYELKIKIWQALDREYKICKSFGENSQIQSSSLKQWVGEVLKKSECQTKFKYSDSRIFKTKDNILDMLKVADYLMKLQKKRLELVENGHMSVQDAPKSPILPQCNEHESEKFEQIPAEATKCKCKYSFVKIASPADEFSELEQKEEYPHIINKRTSNIEVTDYYCPSHGGKKAFEICTPQGTINFDTQNNDWKINVESSEELESSDESSSDIEIIGIGTFKSVKKQSVPKFAPQSLNNYGIHETVKNNDSDSASLDGKDQNKFKGKVLETTEKSDFDGTLVDDTNLNKLKDNAFENAGKSDCDDNGFVDRNESKKSSILQNAHSDYTFHGGRDYIKLKGNALENVVKDDSDGNLLDGRDQSKLKDVKSNKCEQQQQQAFPYDYCNGLSAHLFGNKTNNFSDYEENNLKVNTHMKPSDSKKPEEKEILFCALEGPEQLKSPESLTLKPEMQKNKVKSDSIKCDSDQTSPTCHFPEHQLQHEINSKYLSQISQNFPSQNFSSDVYSSQPRTNSMFPAIHQQIPLYRTIRNPTSDSKTNCPCHTLHLIRKLEPKLLKYVPQKDLTDIWRSVFGERINLPQKNLLIGEVAKGILESINRCSSGSLLNQSPSNTYLNPKLQNNVDINPNKTYYSNESKLIEDRKDLPGGNLPRMFQISNPMWNCNENYINNQQEPNNLNKSCSCVNDTKTEEMAKGSKSQVVTAVKIVFTNPKDQIAPTTGVYDFQRCQRSPKMQPSSIHAKTSSNTYEFIVTDDSKEKSVVLINPFLEDNNTPVKEFLENDANVHLKNQNIKTAGPVNSEKIEISFASPTSYCNHLENTVKTEKGVSIDIASSTNNCNGQENTENFDKGASMDVASSNCNYNGFDSTEKIHKFAPHGTASSTNCLNSHGETKKVFPFSCCSYNNQGKCISLGSYLARRNPEIMNLKRWDFFNQNTAACRSIDNQSIDNNHEDIPSRSTNHCPCNMSNGVVHLENFAVKDYNVRGLHTTIPQAESDKIPVLKHEEKSVCGLFPKHMPTKP